MRRIDPDLFPSWPLALWLLAVLGLLGLEAECVYVLLTSPRRGAEAAPCAEDAR